MNGEKDPEEEFFFVVPDGNDGSRERERERAGMGLRFAMRSKLGEEWRWDSNFADDDPDDNFTYELRARSNVIVFRCRQETTLRWQVPRALFFCSPA